MAHTHRKNRSKKPIHSLARLISQTRPRFGRSTLEHGDKRARLRQRAEQKLARQEAP